MQFQYFKTSVASDAALRFTTFLAADSAGFDRPDGSREPSIVAPTIYPGGPVINVLHDGDVVELRTVLDSVGSQANRSEDALDRYIQETAAFTYPYIEIGVNRSTRLSGLLPPHRGADAYFRATDDAQYFADIFEMVLGQTSYEENCTLALERFPTNLVFGSWNSYVNASARIPRVYRSHIDGITRLSLSACDKGKEAEAIKVFGQAMRRDPFVGGSRNLYNYDNPAGEKCWTIDPKNDAIKPEDLKTFKDMEGKKRKNGEKNSFSLASHGLGDILADKALRGVRIDYAIQSSLISFATLRGFRFPLNGVVSAERNLAGQTYIAALAYLGHELARSRGYFLRSGCSLVATESRREVVAAGSMASAQRFPWDRQSGKSELAIALEIYAAAVADIREHQFVLAPRRIVNAKPELIELLKANGKATGASSEDAEAA